MESLKNAQCSIFENKYCTSPQPITLLEALIIPRQINLIDAIRKCSYKSSMQQYLKGKLLAITPCSLQIGGRGEKFHHRHSGYLAFDVDGLGEKISDTFKEIIQIPYIAYCGKSASGNGLWGLLPIENPVCHKQHFDAMTLVFKKVGVTIDQAPRNVASYRFLSYDSEAYFNDSAIVFKEVIFPQKLEKEALPEKFIMKVETNIWQDFNREASFDLIHNILLSAGWEYHSTHGVKVRYTRPGKLTKDGLSAEYHTGLKTFFVFSNEAPAASFFINKGGGSPCDVVVQYAANGDLKKAYQILKSFTL
jgi:hypothetical protein